MKKTHYALLVVSLIAMGFASSCSQQGEKPAGDGNGVLSAPAALPPSALPARPISFSSSPLANLTPKFDKVGQSAKQGVVVEVNGRRLSATELEVRLAAVLAKMKFRNAQEKQEQSEEIKRRLVNDFVVRSLLEEEIERQKITAPTSEVGKQIEKIKATLPPGVLLDDFIKRRGGSYADFRKELAFGLQVAKLVESQRPVSVSAAEVERFYKQNKDKFVAPELAKIRHILIAASPDLPAAQKKAKYALAEDLRKQLVGGADFASLARSFSDCPSKGNGGELGYLPSERLEENFAKAAFEGEIGKISTVVATSAGFHIIQTLAKQPPRAYPLDEQLRARIVTFIKQQKSVESFHELLKKLRGNAQIKFN